MKMSKEDFIYIWQDSTREDIINQYYYDRKELLETIDKAIEYIEKYNSNNMEYNTQTLLDILKGSDSNVV